MLMLLLALERPVGNRKHSRAFHHEGYGALRYLHLWGRLRACGFELHFY
jgi:hypothetical protein